MGLYDYRPYVKKVINNKQIMYDCDKGYVLENGPVSVSVHLSNVSLNNLFACLSFQSGATCIGGKWSPSELPECLPGQHPRLRWNRRKRSVDLRFARGKFLLNHYRNIKRKHFDHHMVDDFVKSASREKRSAQAYRGRRYYNFVNEAIARSRLKRSLYKRDSRDYTEIDRAYSKYYEKIKARYRNYVKSLFPNPKTKNSSMNNNYPLNDGRWQNSYNNPEFRYRATQKARTFGNDHQHSTDIEEDPPVALPSINDPIKSNRFEKPSDTVSMSNYYPSYYNQERYFGAEDTQETPKKSNSSADNAANIYAQLQSQIVRRKRGADDDLTGIFPCILLENLN